MAGSSSTSIGRLTFVAPAPTPTQLRDAAFHLGDAVDAFESLLELAKAFSIDGADGEEVMADLGVEFAHATYHMRGLADALNWDRGLLDPAGDPRRPGGGR